jgi:hypothetical protein
MTKKKVPIDLAMMVALREAMDGWNRKVGRNLKHE